MNRIKNLLEFKIVSKWWLVKKEQFQKRPLVSMFIIILSSIVLSLIATLVRSPGVTFSATIQTEGFEIVTESNIAVFRDISVNNLNLELLNKLVIGKTETNNILNPNVVTKIKRFSIQRKENGFVKLDSLLIPDKAKVKSKYSKRTNTILLQVETEHKSPKDAHARIVWKNPVEKSHINLSDQMENHLSSNSNVNSFDISTKKLTLLLGNAENGFNMIRPFQVSELLLEQTLRGETDFDVGYRSSLIKGGRIQFFVMGNPLDGRALHAGEALRFKVLDSEVTYLANENGSINIRIFGTAEDVFSGFGSSVTSIYPSLFQGFSASPIIRVSLSIFLGVILAMIGAISIGKNNE